MCEHDGGRAAAVQCVRPASRADGPALLDEALAALLAHHQAVEIDAAYAAYEEQPLDEPEDWGNLASFRAAAAAS